MYSQALQNYIILILVAVSLTGCETLFGKSEPARYSRTASIEHKRDEEVFTTSYEILFATKSLQLDEEGQATVERVADLIAKSKPALVIVSGYSDSYGDAAYNRQLSKRRAIAVSKALKAQGVENRLIQIQAFGEDDPSVPTQDNVKILENRRVVIEIKK